MSMHIPEAEARKLAELDVQRYGNGFYRKRADGLAEHIPASSVVLIAAPQQAEPDVIKEIACSSCGLTMEESSALAAMKQAEPRADERASFELPDLPEPFAIDWPSLNAHALGCGVEDRGLYDRYDCANYGFEDGVDKAASCVPSEIYDADQMREYAQAAISAWQARATQSGQRAGVAEGDSK